MLSKSSIEKRDKRISRYINLIQQKRYKYTTTYLKSAMDVFYTHEKQNNTNIYTSKPERSMRITNQRRNVGEWSDTGTLSVSNIRCLLLQWNKSA